MPRGTDVSNLKLMGLDELKRPEVVGATMPVKKKPAKLTDVAAWSPVPIKRKLMFRNNAGKRHTHTVSVEHREDPKQKLMNEIGSLPEGIVQFSRILVAIYQAPIVHKTAGGILLTEGMKEEDLQEYFWQGKVGLIVAMGQQAYEDDETTKFHGTKNKVGDWVWFHPSSGMACEVNNVFCRYLLERDIVGKIPHPDYVW